MEKKKKLLALVILFSAIFLLPNRAYAMEPLEADVVAPMVGEYFSDIIWGSWIQNSDEYEFSFDLHNDTDNVKVLENTLIKKNKEYTLSVRISRSDDGVLPGDFAVNLQFYDKSDFYVSKTNPVQTATYWETRITYNTRTSKNKIYGRNVLDNFGTPVVGKNVTYNVMNEKDPNRAKYSITQGWYEEGSDVKLTTNSKFQAGKRYEYRLELNTNDGYYFSDYLEIIDECIKENGYYVYRDFNEEEIQRDIETIKRVYLFDTTQNANTIYGPINLNVPSVSIGSEIKKIESTDPRYTILSEWVYRTYDNWEATPCKNGDVFEAGKSYEYQYRLEPTGDYELEYNLQTIINGLPQNDNIQQISHDWGQGSVNVNYADYSISAIQASTYNAAPKVGQKPKETSIFSYTGGEETRYEITSQKWYVGNTLMGANQTFAKNNNYKLVVTYRAKDNFIFSDYARSAINYFESDFFVNSTTESPNNKEVTVTFNFNIQYQDYFIYESDGFNPTAPVIGNSPVLASVISDNFMIEKQVWYNLTDQKEMAATDEFERDKAYEYRFKLKAKTGLHFSREFIPNLTNFENSPYYDKEYHIYQLDGGVGAIGGENDTVYEMSIPFVMSNKLNDSNYVYGYVDTSSFITLPKAGEKISYKGTDSEEYQLRSYRYNGLNIEKGWYEKGSDKVLPEGSTFELNKTYEFHIRYMPIGTKKIISKSILYFDTRYVNYQKSPYYKGIKRNDTNNSAEFIIEFEMPGTSYDNDTTIIKSVNVDNVLEATVGGHVVYNLAGNTSKYNISENWREVDGLTYKPGDRLPANTVFEANKYYIHEIIFTKKAGFKFDAVVDANIGDISEDGMYQEISEDGNSLIYTINYWLYETDPDEPKDGKISFKKNEYSTGSKTYTIPAGVDTLTLEVDKKTNEFDLSFYGELTTYDIDYDIDNNIVTITGLNEFAQNNPECKVIYVNVIGDENEEYRQFNDNYVIVLGSNEKTAVVLPTITDYEGIVDGQPHSIGVSGGSGGTIMYSLNLDGPWQTAKPQTAFAGVTKIYVKVEPDEKHIALLPTYGIVTLYENDTECTITFHSNDGTNKTVSQTTKLGEPTKLRKNTFTRDNYQFESWTTNADGSGYSYSDETYVAIENNIDLYAKWKSLVPDDFDVSYTTHVQSYGWQKYVVDGAMAGTSGEAKRLEGIKIKLNSNKHEGNIEYRTHIQSYGWEKEFKKNDEMSGTSGEAKRLEAIEIKLSGDVAENFDVYYRVHAQKFGWLGWARNGEEAGTAGYAYRLEGIEIKLIPKGESVEGYGEEVAFKDKYAVESVTLNKTNISLEVDDTANLIATVLPSAATDKVLTWTSDNESSATVDANGKVTAVGEGTATITAKTSNGKQATCSVNVLPPIPGVAYQTHVQSYGWQDYVKNGEMSGTSGEAKRLEGIKIKLRHPEYSGDILYRTHIQSYGWEEKFKKNDEFSGTSGEAKRLEAIEIKLSGEMEEHFDIYYRVHAQSFGWLNWAKNGERSGTAGYAKRLEGIEIVLVEKGGQPPERSNQNDERAYIEK